MRYRILKNIKTILPIKDHVIYNRAILPERLLRCCGPKFKNNSYYLESAETEARRLAEHFDCNNTFKILDIGCGPGRLATGILRVIGELTYEGLDVNRESVSWCKRHIESKHPQFHFHYIDVGNEQYNKEGKKLDDHFKFNYPDRSFDIVYLYSVFSHMRERNMRIYLADFRRILKPNGKVFLTTFVEENVPNLSINPTNYVLKKYMGPLNIVRYEKNCLFSIIENYGFLLGNFSHRTETDYQSAIYFSKSH